MQEVKGLIDGLNLVQAKALVAELPQTLKADITKDDAQAIKEKLEAVGAQVEIS